MPSNTEISVKLFALLVVQYSSQYHLLCLSTGDNHFTSSYYYYYYYYYMIYIAPISRIESEALASLGGEHD